MYWSNTFTYIVILAHLKVYLPFFGDVIYLFMLEPSLIPRPFVGEMAWVQGKLELNRPLVQNWSPL